MLSGGVRTLALISLISLSWLLSIHSEPLKEGQPTNLLWIMFDDLRPDLSVYGKSHMITPNFDRLAARSVVFDIAITGISVCNPSRDSLLTGLRPDTVGTYGFQHSFHPNLNIPSRLIHAGYRTASVGKVPHWPSDDRNMWSVSTFDNHWYDFQSYENGIMNSSTMPDKKQKEENFRDSIYAQKALDVLDFLVNKPPKPKEGKDKDGNEDKSVPPWMLAVGFKLPHLQVHIPYSFYEMYKNRSYGWKLGKKELMYPRTSPDLSYVNPIDGRFKFMREEGARDANRTIDLMKNGRGLINTPYTFEMYNELMMGYAAAVTFVDKQVGKLLDAMDKHDLWGNTTIVLTADHGMHNGEKGIWNKWSVFDEATRVPLIISHPNSPFKGKRYKEPVELVDIFPTLNDILGIQKPEKSMKKACKRHRCLPLSGKSLAPVILGNKFMNTNFPTGNVTGTNDERMVTKLNRTFALSQITRCLEKHKLINTDLVLYNYMQTDRKSRWLECNMDKRYSANAAKGEVSLIAYSMRTLDYRYTAYFHMKRSLEKSSHKAMIVDFASPPYSEELYDHKNESLGEFTHRETVNLSQKPMYKKIIEKLKGQLVAYITNEVIFHDTTT